MFRKKIAEINNFPPLLSSPQKTLITPIAQLPSPVDEEENISSTTTTTTGKEPLVQLRNAKDDQLNKCISELSSSFRRCASESTDKVGPAPLPSSSSTTAKETPRPASMAAASHFVTVIEVKESQKAGQSKMAAQTMSNSREASESEEDRLETKEEAEEEEEEDVTGHTNTTDDESLAETGRTSSGGGVQRNKSGDSSGFGSASSAGSVGGGGGDSGQQSNVMRLINKNNAVLAGHVTTTSNKQSTFSSNNNNGDKIGLLQTSAAADMPKKRIPPR